MKKNPLTIIGIVLLLGLSSHPTVSLAYQTWYASYSDQNYAGIWANIWTPYDAIIMPLDPIGAAGQSHSVTNPGPYWIQSGWRFPAREINSDYPVCYYEYCRDGCETDPTKYRIIELNPILWGTFNKFEISNQSGNTWCVWIDGIQQTCVDNIQFAPTQVIAQSEIHDDPRIWVSTKFENLKIKDPTTGYWIDPIQIENHISAMWPYRAFKISQDSFATTRYSTSYLSFISK